MGKTEAPTPLTPLILLQDNPCEQLDGDHLSLKTYATIVASAAVGNEGPFTIGVFGDWGTGKTSLLHLAQKKVDADTQYETITVWFNAWQHEREEEPLLPLIAAILEAIKAQESKLTEAAKGGVMALGALLYAIAVATKSKVEVGFDGFAKAGLEHDGAKFVEAFQAFMKVENGLTDELLYVKAYKLLREMTQDPNIKIIIFIDDLDRCDPEKAVHLLESIKLILNQKGFVFVLALAHKVVTKYLDHVYLEKYKLDERDWGEFYLQKIINLPIELPHHGPNFKQFAKDMVEDLIKKYIEKIKEQAKDKKQNISEEQIEKLIPNEVRALETIAEPLAGGAQFNPRSFVRHANKFLVNARLWEAKHNGKTGSTNSKGISTDDALLIAMDTIMGSILTDSELYELAKDNELCEQIFQEVIGG